MLPLSLWWAQSVSSAKYLPMSSANLSRELFWCFSRSAQCLLNGLDRCSSWACSQLSSCQCPRWESCWYLSGLDSPFLPKSFRVSSINVCQRFLWCLLLNLSALFQVLSREDLLVSAWTEFACLQYLPGELNQREVSPTACLSVSSSGSLGFLLGRASRSFSCLLPSVSRQSYPQELMSFCYSVSLFCWSF